MTRGEKNPANLFRGFTEGQAVEDDVYGKNLGNVKVQRTYDEKENPHLLLSAWVPELDGLSFTISGVTALVFGMLVAIGLKKIPSPWKPVRRLQEPLLAG